MHLQQRFPQPHVASRLVAVDDFRDREAEFLGEHAHRVLEADLFMELQELEDIAANAAAEAMKKSLLGIDMKRRCLLPMKRTESLVSPSRTLQRYVLLDDRQDIGLKPKVINKGLGKECHRSWF